MNAPTPQKNRISPEAKNRARARHVGQPLPCCPNGGKSTSLVGATATAQDATKRRRPEATLKTLQRIFTLPEGDDTTLGRIDREIATNLHGFLQDSIVAHDTAPADLEKAFVDTTLQDDPIYVSEQADFLLNKVVAQSVHVSSPHFVGHMTSAIPYFMIPLAKIMIALNQNLVKIETSKAFTPLERQVLGILHRLVYQQSSAFYSRHTQNPNVALGAFCSGGTIANITAMWVALNKLFKPNRDFAGLGEDGLVAAIQHSPYDNVAFVVSQRGHYSLRKAANLLGIGKRQLVAIPCDEHNRMRLPDLVATLNDLHQRRIAIAAVIGIAGTTETGSIDPLADMAKICQEWGIHFHVDAAWGGPALFSDKHRQLLAGIEAAASVTLDAHKQLYVPMGAGMVLFKDPKDLTYVEHSAQYIIRRGSRDLGRKTLEGSRPGMAMLVHSGLRIMGRKGYELLIDQGVAKAQWFAQHIAAQTDFELISAPELNILTYRYVPPDMSAALQASTAKEQRRLNKVLNNLTVSIQKEQREKGKTFVSRTTLTPAKYAAEPITVFRVVLANPLTKKQHLRDILAEQRHIAATLFAAPQA